MLMMLAGASSRGNGFQDAASVPGKTPCTQAWMWMSVTDMHESWINPV